MEPWLRSSMLKWLIYNCQMTIEYADALKVWFWFFFFVCAEYMYFCILAAFIYKEKSHNDN